MCVTAECGYDSRRPDNGALTRRDDRTKEDTILAVATATLSIARRAGPHNARQTDPTHHASRRQLNPHTGIGIDLGPLYGLLVTVEENSTLRASHNRFLSVD
jgi:hypothetical protein